MAERIYFAPDDVGPPLDPYTHAIKCGDTVYIAGQVALDEHNQLVGIGDPHRQAEQCWENIRRAVESAGGTLADIVKMTIFLKDIRHAPHEMEVRAKLFKPGNYPVCTQVQVANLALHELLMEIDVTAVLGSVS
jgi:2-iminobutanoate/2-iminopropanoate deaminase